MASKLKKLLICPYFGDMPEWYDKYEKPVGYDILIDTNLEDFKERCKAKLNLDYRGLPNTGKVWDIRCALGVLYEDELKGYDFWGHTDFDCVYGDVDKWVSDEFLSNLDIHSNHNTYMMGAWSLYRNIPEVNNLFKKRFMWSLLMTNPEPLGWVETDYSRIVEQSGLRYAYTFWQGNPYDENPVLKKEDGKLYQDIKKNGKWEEIMMFHFRRSKRWPLK